MFIDEARIRVKAGDGGNGCMAFRREKFVPRGGPSGGDGGHGGDILMTSSLSHNTLVHFRFNPEHKGGRGGHGEGSNCSGAAGTPVTLQVPVGTLLYDDDSNQLVHDFAHPDESLVIAHGGRGGRGNQHFATSTHQAPREHELGRPGEERHFRLELRLLADAGLVGYPNVGKSTLISRLSAARPKIANYAFTTLEPNLGVVSVGEWPHERSFVIADLPGLIEGAHLGAGLGVQFLRHIERTSVIVHVVDVSDASGRPDPVEDFKLITGELRSFDASLAQRPTVVVAAKADVANPEKVKKLSAMARRRKLPFFLISAVTGEGVDKLKYALADLVAQHRPSTDAHIPLPPSVPPIPHRHPTPEAAPREHPPGCGASAFSVAPLTRRIGGTSRSRAEPRTTSPWTLSCLSPLAVSRSRGLARPRGKIASPWFGCLSPWTPVSESLRWTAPSPGGAPNYTVNTLCELRSTFFEATIFSISGADSFLDLPRWRDPSALLTLAEWIVVSRPGYSLSDIEALPLTAEQRARVHLLATVEDPVSATALRASLAREDDVSGLLPTPVLTYIQEHGLYSTNAGPVEEISQTTL